MNSRVFRAIGMVAAAGLLMVVAGPLAQGNRPVLKTHAAAPDEARTIPSVLPPLRPGAMNTESTSGSALPILLLSYDDGTCESGLGLAGTHTALMNFDVPPTCFSVDIVGVTGRVNTGTATAFHLHQGPSLGLPGSPDVAVGMTFAAQGPCPATGFSTNVITPGVAVVTGTSNFFGGLAFRNSGGFTGRDTNGGNNMRQWILCPICGMTSYSPAVLSGIGLGGNLMIRLTVEASGFCPVELLHFGAE